MEAYREGFVELPDVKIEYAMYGKQDGPYMLLLPGNGGDMHGFDGGLVNDFAPYFSVLTVSPRGTGNSTRGTTPMTFEAMVGDLVGVLDALGIEKTNIFGFSDGGNLAICFAHAHPERVIAFTAMGSNINTRGTKTRDQLKIHLRFKKLSREYERTHDEAVSLRRDITGMMVGQPKLRYRDLKSINLPFMNIFGEHDMIKRSHSRRISKAVPGSEEMMILNKGHGSSFDKRELILVPVLLKFYKAQ